jgi:small subunit ribosomal protein S6
LNDYELMTILNPEIKDEDVSDTVDKITQFITNRGGEIQNIDQWGRRRLAYPIDRASEGTYVVTHLKLPPANAAELEANLKISEDVIRHLLVRYSPAEQAAAIAAAQRRRPRPIEEGGEEGRAPEPAAAEAGASATAEAATSQPGDETATASPPEASAPSEPEAATAEATAAVETTEAAAPAEPEPAAEETEAAEATAPEAQAGGEAEAAPETEEEKPESEAEKAPARRTRARKPAEEA